MYIQHKLMQMNTTELKIHLTKLKSEIPENHAIRLHRAISWLQCADKYSKELDLQFISLWISFNSCYAIPPDKDNSATEKERFGSFVAQLIRHDAEKRFYNLLWQKFSSTVRLLLENEYLYKPFWDYQRGEIKEWRLVFQKSLENSLKYLSNQQVPELLEVVLDRLYTLRNQLIHGGATYNSKINRQQLIDGCKMLQLMIPIIIEIMLSHPNDKWGEISYPVII